jgi:DDE_Tnp_1-associated
MDEATAAGAITEAVVFLEYFKDLADPRQRGKVIYPLAEVLLLCLLAVLAGAETFVDIARFGEKKIELLRRFRRFRDGTPSHDHLGDIFAVLDAAQFQRCFVAWVGALTGASGDVIAIDGKTARRSFQKKGAKAPIHMVSAFAARQRLVLGQVKAAEKSNEIVAIPNLLEMLEIEGAIVTIDAMGSDFQMKSSTPAPHIWRSFTARTEAITLRSSGELLANDAVLITRQYRKRHSFLRQRGNY